ncbi:tol-pal system-associated acyl-CoA thioesterase [Prosthecodimorpha staleyi]|uniref:Tol-pal system-associated acyl-CoA thioesterase n=1 Tax=Prosthecodimorpha staleyi TaxID=2840188 RepID=A0A947D0P9_9HYPH|nr:tol-pal system-associated acyl-CoA thioesterase [Prosthecodimorpha staleyi]MBT9288795.1 tol-pal system-associated acyl-CoA thioesterase [Prosthecodimorpha staleyi]
MTAGHSDRALAGRIDQGIHRLDLRIYWEDTDAGGIVYHAGYVRFMERGRTDFLRLAGIRQSELAAGPDGILFAVRHMDLDFRKPARLDDLLQVTTAVEEIAGARLVMRQAVLRGGETLVAARVTVAAISLEGRPRRIPMPIRAALGGGATAAAD